MASLLPARCARNPHHFPYADDPIAIAHVAVALVSYALFTVAAVQALVMLGLEKRLHRRLPEAGADGTPPLLTLERVLFRLIDHRIRAADAHARQRHAVLRADLRQAGHVHAQGRVLGLAWLTFGALLWGRWRYGWRGRVALRWILTGTVFVFLAYIG